jgi:hypothetical protein
MVRKHFRLVLGYLRELTFEGLSDPGMERAARLP